LLIVVGAVLTANLSKMVAREGASMGTQMEACLRETCDSPRPRLSCGALLLVAGRLTGYLGSI
jgi:hypothetical protein